MKTKCWPVLNRLLIEMDSQNAANDPLEHWASFKSARALSGLRLSYIVDCRRCPKLHRVPFAGSRAI
jgi:hypothetical protein